MWAEANIQWNMLGAASGVGVGLLILMLAIHTQRRGGQMLLSVSGWLLLLIGGAGCVASLPAMTPPPAPAAVQATFEPFFGSLPAANPTVPAPVALSTPSPSINFSPTAVVADEPPPLTEPARLQIPELSVDEPISVVPIREGLWDLENLGPRVGWLTTTGAHPEDKWAMVLVGHITLTSLERGAFADLEKIKKGTVLTYRANGMEYVYEVREKGRVAPADIKALYVPDGKVLLLMTCTDFNILDQAYANRLLVRAELIEKRPLVP